MPLAARIAPAFALVILTGFSTAASGEDLFSSLSQSQSSRNAAVSTPVAAPSAAAEPSTPDGSASPASDQGDTTSPPPSVVWADFQPSPAAQPANVDDAHSLHAAAHIEPPAKADASEHAETEPSVLGGGQPHAGTLVVEGTPLALKPPATKAAYPTPSLMGGLPPMVAVGSSLAIVLGLFFIFVWAMRRTTPHGSRALPSEVVETLGRVKLAQRQQLYLLRCGRKLLLVSVTPSGVETLTEVTDPDEAAHLAGLCRQSQPGSSTTAFRQVFSQMAGERNEFDRFADTPGRYYGRGSMLEDRDV